MMNTLKRQGFTFSKKFEQSLNVTGTNATDAAKKAARLKSINMTSLKQKVTGYTTDQGKKLKGSQARSEGFKLERKKRREEQKARISGIINIEDRLGMAVDKVFFDDYGNHMLSGEEVDVTPMKQEAIREWDNYRRTVPVKEMDISVIEDFYAALDKLLTPSQSPAEYDDSVQNAIAILKGLPMDPDRIQNDETMENIT